MLLVAAHGNCGRLISSFRSVFLAGGGEAVVGVAALEAHWGVPVGPSVALVRRPPAVAVTWNQSTHYKMTITYISSTLDTHSVDAIFMTG